MTTHPSYLQLDRHCAGLTVAPATVMHVPDCARCRAYVESYAPAAEVPTWLEVAENAPLVSPVHAARPRWLRAAGAVAMAAAICLAVLWPRADQRYDGVKGQPSVLIYVQRNGVIGIWDGAPLHAGDRVRLEVKPEEFEYASVFSVSAKPPLLRPLYQGRVVRGASSVLPKAWELDAAPEPERLVVILSHALLSASAAEALLRARDPREVWLLHVSLPKEKAR